MLQSVRNIIMSYVADRCLTAMVVINENGIEKIGK